MSPVQYGVSQDFNSAEGDAMSTGKFIEFSTYRIVFSVVGNVRDSDNESNTALSNVDNTQQTFTSPWVSSLRRPENSATLLRKIRIS